MNEDKVREFNRFFTKEYKYLRGFAKSIDIRNDYESLLHDCYLKCLTRIAVSGYSGSTYLNFVRVTITNSYKTAYRDKKHTQDIETPEISNEVEEQLQSEQQYQDYLQAFNLDVSYINTYIYAYVNRYYDLKHEYIFKTYTILKHKQLTYKQLSTATGFTLDYVSKIVRRIKKDLQKHLWYYIQNGEELMDKKLLVEKVGVVIQTDFNRNLGNYKDVYIEVFGHPWTGCSCNMRVMRQQLIDWYNQNKDKL